MIVNRRLLISILLLILLLIAKGQSQQRNEVLGKVTYISSQNTYVQFENTNGIQQGDTLYTKVKGKLHPALKVSFISKRSCAGSPFNSDNLKIGDQLFALITIKQAEKIIVKDSIVVENKPQQPDTIPIKIITSGFSRPKRTISNGRISIQSYSNLNSGKFSSEDQRWRYTVSYNAEGIGESGFSFSSYFNYAYRAADWKTMQNNPWDNLKVYDLSFGYDFDEQTTIRIGRYLNPKVSNISSVDGLQFQTKFSNFFGGLIIGSRPDFATLGFNSKLFEYGAYIGRSDTINSRLMENTIAFFQQTNNFKTDRRFIYFQHNNSLLKNLNMFLSSEIDLYALEKGEGKNKPSLTSFFLSTHYSPVRMISFSLSYDARKNVIYYETFKTTIDSIIENETRQGIRLGTNIRPFNNLFIGLNAGYRFLKKDIKPSRNFNGYLTYSQIPFVEISPTLSYTRLISNYVDGSIYGIRLSKYLSFIDYSLSLAFSKVEYDYLASFAKLRQNNFSVDISGRVWEQLFLSCSFEGVFEDGQNYSRVLIDLSFRF